MIKSILLASFLMAFAFIAMPVSSAQACDTCGCAGAHAHPHADNHAKKPCEKVLGEKAPCTKCATAGKPCGCDKKGEKKPCEKTLGKKEPCEKTLGENAMKKHQMAPISTTDHSKKGSFTFKSKSRFTSNGSGS